MTYELCQHSLLQTSSGQTQTYPMVQKDFVPYRSILKVENYGFGTCDCLHPFRQLIYIYIISKVHIM